MFTHDPNAPIALVGGSGVVGRRLAPLLARLEDRELLIAGRSLERAEATLAAVRAANGCARFAALDLTSAPQRLQVSAVVGLVNDPEDAVLLGALRAGVPFVDITRWTRRVTAAVGRVVVAGIRAPVILASGWMGGLLPRVAALLARELGGSLDRIDGSVRYALNDASGPDSVDYIDRFWIPFDATRDGRPVVVRPLSEARRTVIAGRSTTVRRFDTPEQWSLPLTLGVRSAAVGLGFDRAFAGTALAVFARSGMFGWFASPRFRSLRHALLRSEHAEQRAGAPAAFRVDAVTRSGDASSLTVSTREGQAALTAVGAWLSLRFALAEPDYAGVRFPEQDPENAALRSLVARAGLSAGRDVA